MTLRTADTASRRWSITYRADMKSANPMAAHSLSMPIFRLFIAVGKTELVVPAQPIFVMNRGMEKLTAHSSYSAAQSMLYSTSARTRRKNSFFIERNPRNMGDVRWGN